MPLSVFAEGGLKHSKHVNDLTRPSRTTQVNIPPLVKVKSLSRVQLFATPRTVAYQAPPSMGFSRPECWSGLPFPSPGDLPDPGIEPRSPALRRRFTVWAIREAGSNSTCATRNYFYGFHGFLNRLRTTLWTKCGWWSHAQFGVVFSILSSLYFCCGKLRQWKLFGYSR